MTEFKKAKPTNTPEQHIAKLRERGLTIQQSDETHVTHSLLTIGYFRLSGYFGPLQQSKDVFHPGNTFADVLRLYTFDKNLRKLTSHALKTLEIAFKTHLTNIMSSSFESDWYDNPEIFMTDKTKSVWINNYRCEDGKVVEYAEEVQVSMYKLLKQSINKYIERNEDAEYIKKFREDYGKDAIVPSWMMMECISFGELSKLFTLIKPSRIEARELGQHYGAKSADTFASWLHGFAVLRNACAHHSRIWNRKLMKDLKFPKRDVHKFISECKIENTRRFYGISACLLKCLSVISMEEYDNYKKTFYQLIKDHSIKPLALGFPEKIEPHDVWYIETETI